MWLSVTYLVNESPTAFGLTPMMVMEVVTGSHRFRYLAAGRSGVCLAFGVFLSDEWPSDSKWVLSNDYTSALWTDLFFR